MVGSLWSDSDAALHLEIPNTFVDYFRIFAFQQSLNGKVL